MLTPVKDFGMFYLKCQLEIQKLAEGSVDAKNVIENRQIMWRPVLIIL